MKIISWNINSVRARAQHLQDLIKKHAPDIILLQELKCTKAQFPFSAFDEFGYNIYIQGQKSWNGVAILSKFPVDYVETSFDGYNLPEQARFQEAEISLPDAGYFRLINLYAPNGGEIDSDKFKLKMEFYDNFIKYLSRPRSFDEKIIIAGDLNIAPYDIDVYDAQRLRNHTCASLAEQKLLRQILGLGFYDLYRLANPATQEFSWWDYRGGALEQNKGMRIDFFLASAAAANIFTSCTIDYDARTQKSTSDHAPVIIS